MIYNSKSFVYDGQSSGMFIDSDGKPIRILNVVLNSDMYSQPMIGARTIKEVKIPGRSRPYLYEVDEDPLEFDLNIAFEEPVKVSDARKIVRWLLTPKTYKALEFESDENKVFYSVFTGQPRFTYVNQGSEIESDKTITVSHTTGTNTTIILHDAISATMGANQTYNSSTNLFTILAAEATGVYQITYKVRQEKLVGYITLHARCNAPTAFSKESTTGLLPVESNESVTLNVDGDDFTEPDIVIDIPANLGITINASAITLDGIIIRNLTNGSFIGFNGLVADEIITVNSFLKTITSDKQSISAIYPRWNRTELQLEIDANAIEIELYENLVFNSDGDTDTTPIAKVNGDYIGATQIYYKFTYQAPRYL